MKTVLYTLGELIRLFLVLYYFPYIIGIAIAVGLAIKLGEMMSRENPNPHTKDIDADGNWYYLNR